MTILTALKNVRTRMIAWDESKHPRDKGRFASSPSSSAAMKHTAQANKSSRTANKTGSAAAHKSAEISHIIAAASHISAQYDSTNEKQKNFHRKMEDWHIEQSDKHRAKSQTAIKAKRSATRLIKALRASRPAANRMTFTAPVKLRARSADGDRPFTGIAYTGQVMFPTITIGDRKETGGWILDLDTLQIPRQDIPVLDDHDESAEGTIGRTTRIVARKPRYDLAVVGLIYASKKKAQPYLQAAQSGHVWQLSVGTDNFTIQRIADNETVEVNGKVFTGPISIARNAILTDVSFTAIGADDKTTATIAASRA